MQTGRRLTVALVALAVLGSTVVGFTAATGTSATQLDANESTVPATTEQPITEVATTVEGAVETNSDVTTNVEVTPTHATTQASVDDSTGTEASTSVAPATEVPTTAAPTATPDAPNPTSQETTTGTSGETSVTTSNEPVESATSGSAEQSAVESATATETTVVETPTKASVEVTPEVTAVADSPNTSLETTVEANVETATSGTVEESTTAQTPEVTTTETTDEAVDADSVTTVESNSADAVATVAESDGPVASDDPVKASLTDSTETGQSEAVDNRSVADTTVPSPSNSLESVRTTANATEAATSVDTAGTADESVEKSAESVTTDQPTETVTAPVDSSSDDGAIAGDVPSNASSTVGNSVATVEDEIENEQVAVDSIETTEHADDVVENTTNDVVDDSTNAANSANETINSSAEPIDESTAAATTVEERVGGDESLDSTSNETAKNSLDSVNESTGVTDEPVNAIADSTEGGVTSVESTYEGVVDEVNVSSKNNTFPGTNGSDDELTTLGTLDDSEAGDVSDETTDITDEMVETVNGTADSTANASNEPLSEEPADVVNVSVVELSTTETNESHEEPASLDGIGGIEPLAAASNESIDATDEPVNGSVDSTANAVESPGPVVQEPVDEVNLSSLGAHELESIEEGSDTPTNLTDGAVDETVGSTEVTDIDANATIDSAVEESVNETLPTTLDDSAAVVNESDESTSLHAIDSSDSLDGVVVESTNVTDEPVNGSVDSTANTVASIEPTLEEPADEVNLSSLDGSTVVSNDSDDEVASITAVGDSDSLDGVVDESTDVTGQTDELTDVLESNAIEDVTATTDEPVDVAADSTANTIESAEPLFENSDDVTVTSLEDSSAMTNDSDDLTTLDTVGDSDSLDGVIDEPTAITTRTAESNDVLESDAVEDVTGTTDETVNDATVTDLDGSVDPLLASLEETAGDTAIESSTATTDASRATDLVVDGAEAASDTLETDDSLVAEVDSTVDDETVLATELAGVRPEQRTVVETTDLTESTTDLTNEVSVDSADVEPLDESVSATDDLAGTVEDADPIVSHPGSIDATIDAERIDATEAELLIDRSISDSITSVDPDPSIDSSVDSMAVNIDGTLVGAEETAGTIVGSASTTGDGATLVEIGASSTVPSSWNPDSTSVDTRADASGTAGTIESAVALHDDPAAWIHPAVTATGDQEGDRQNGGLLAPGRAVDLGGDKSVDASRIRPESNGVRVVARSTPDGDGPAAGSALASGQSGQPVEGEPSPLNDPETRAVLGLMTIVAGAAAVRFTGTAPALQAALQPSLVHLQLRAGVHTIQYWWDRLSLPRIGPIPGYSRYDDSDPLENDARRDVYESIERLPGVYLTRLSEESSIPRSTVRYHARILESEGLVSAVKVRGRRRFFPAESDGIELATALSDDATAAILGAVAEHEPASGSKIAERLDRDPSTVSHHLKRLSDDGLVVREREGCAVLNRLSPDARETLTASDPQSGPPQAKA